MSKRWRDKQKQGETYNVVVTSNADDANVYEGYLAYNPDPYGGSNTPDLLGVQPQEAYTESFPGQRESIHGGEFDPAMAAHYPGQGVIRDQIDWEIGGVAGQIDRLPYSTGVVSSDLVEDFWMQGEQAIIRRGRNPSMYGAVQTSDPNAILTIQLAQAAAMYFPSAQSQADVARSV